MVEITGDTTEYDGRKIDGVEFHTELRHHDVPPVAAARQFETWPGA